MRRELRVALGAALVLSIPALVCVLLGRWTAPVSAGLTPATEEHITAPARPQSMSPASEAPSARPESSAPAEPVRSAPDEIDQWIERLAHELRDERFEPRVFNDMLQAARSTWRAQDSQVVSSLLADPPRDDGACVALVCLAREQELDVPPAMLARLRSLASRADGARGLALESARSLVRLGGADELGWWCGVLENSHSANMRTIAGAALSSVASPASANYLVQRALELAGTPAANRLLDALGHALTALPSDRLGEARWSACSMRVAELAEDGRVGAGLRARALGLLATLAPARALALAQRAVADPASDSELVDRSAAMLRGHGEARAAFDTVLADPRLDPARRVRLAECVLEGDSSAAEGLRVLRETALSAGDAGLRRRAMHALARYGTPEDRDLVVAAAGNDRDPTVRAAAKSSLRRADSDWR